MTDDIERSIAQSACRQLLARYAIAVDTLDLERLVSVFIPDLTWVRPGSPPMRGHADVRTFFTRIMAGQVLDNPPHGHLTRHLFTTVSIELVSGDRAEGVAYALVYRDTTFQGATPCPMPPSPELVVEYRDTFVRTAEGWRISQHEAIHVFRATFYRQIALPPEAAAQA